MSLHCLDDVFSGAKFLKYSPPNLHMRAGDFMIHRLANIVEKGGSFGYCGIGTEFLSEHARDMGHLNRVLEDILAVACAEMKPAENCDNTGIQIVYSAFVDRFLSFFLDNFVYFLLGVLYRFFYFCRLNSSVHDKALKSDSGYLPSDRIKRRERN